MATEPCPLTPTQGPSARGDISLEASWHEAAARLEALYTPTEQLLPDDWNYLGDVCALCRAAAQPWDYLLHALHVPKLLCNAISVLLTNRQHLQDGVFEHLLTVVMATDDLLRAAYHDAHMQQEGAAFMLQQTCNVLSNQVAQSGLLDQLPVVLNDVTEAVTAGESGVYESSSSSSYRLVLLGLPLLQLFREICTLWPGGVLCSSATSSTAAAALQLALAVLSHDSSRRHIPSMLYWTSAMLITQLTDPTAVVAAAAASSNTSGSTACLTACPDFLQAVVVVLALQAHWLLQPAAASICSNRHRRHSSGSIATSSGNDSLQCNSCSVTAGSGWSAAHLTNSGSSASSSSSFPSSTLTTFSSLPLPGSSSSSSIPINSATSSKSSRRLSRPSSWLFRSVSNYWLHNGDSAPDAAPTQDQQQQQQQQQPPSNPHPTAFYPAHALLLDHLGLQQHKLYELVEVVYTEGDRHISESSIELQLHVFAQLSQRMRAMMHQQARALQAGLAASEDVVADQLAEVLRLQQLVPVLVLSMAAHSPSHYGLVVAAAAAVQEALAWWPLGSSSSSRLPQALHAGECDQHAGECDQQPPPILPVLELLQLLVQTIQNVLHQPDTVERKRKTGAVQAAAANHSSVHAGQVPNKAAALDALADAVSALTNACVACDVEGGLSAWQQDSQPLAEAFSSVLQDAAAAADFKARKSKANAYVDKLLVALLYAERFFFMDITHHVQSPDGTAAGRAQGEAGQLLALLLSTL